MFRILYFRQSVLKRAEMADGDLLEVIEQATEHGSGERAEIWSDERGKIGVVEPLPRQASATNEICREEPQAEIAKEMKQRLSLVHSAPARNK